MSTPAGTEHPDRFIQFKLFDAGIDLARLRAEQDEMMIRSRPFNTVRGYAHSWKVFTRWCEEAGQLALPAAPKTLALFVTWAAMERGYRMAYVQHILSAVRDKHRSEKLPVPIDNSVREVMAAAARSLQEEPGGKEAITPTQLRAACDRMDDTVIGIRDRALLLVGFASGWRRSELSSLRLSDVRFTAEGIVLRQGKSKSDQVGKGRKVRIPYAHDPTLCPVRALEGYLKVRGRFHGPLFVAAAPTGGLSERALSEHAICLRVKRALEGIGVDSRPYGAHSLRSGMVTSALESGADIVAVMQRTGHKRMDTVLRYIRPAETFRADPLAGVL